MPLLFHRCMSYAMIFSVVDDVCIIMILGQNEHTHSQLSEHSTRSRKKTITEQQPREKQTFKDDGNYVFTITDRFHLNVSDLCCCCLPAAAAIHIYIYLKQLHGTHTHIHILKAYILKTILQYKLINNQVNRYR